MKDFLSISKCSVEELNELLALSVELKKLYKSGGRDVCLSGKTLGMLFEKVSLRTRILDILAQVSEDALTAGMLAADPVAAAARMQEVLLLVRQGHPLSPHLYSAQIRLAHYQRDVLGKPDAAAASLERMLTDLDLPLEGVALARLTLGECYLAAGDTARGRLVLTRLGRGSRFREAAGHAHYHLARLDLAEGHWETARDRFASVALDNPMANYANNALDLGLAIAEELDNPTGGPAMLTLYARSSYFDLTVQPDSQRVALERYIRVASRQLDLEQPQHLLERSRFELARLYSDTGRLADALTSAQVHAGLAEEKDPSPYLHILIRPGTGPL